MTEHADRLILEVMYKADYCLLCYYMDEAICEVLPKYGDKVHYQRVEFLRSPGRERFLELSVSLFGHDGVYRHRRIAPVPSLFIDGELVFEGIPPQYELLEAIDEALEERGLI